MRSGQGLVSRHGKAGEWQNARMSVPTESPLEVPPPLGTHELKRWLDAYVKGGCSATTLNRSLTALCRDNPGAASEALLLLARYDDEGHLQLRNLEILRTRLEDVARGEGSETPDVTGLQDTSHARAATELRPVADAAPATVLLPSPGIVPVTEFLAESMQAEREVALPSLGHAPPAPAHSGRTRGAPTRTPIGPGSVLRERYVLEDRLGMGGMGTVYRALDRNRLDLAYEQRHVALKVLRDEFARRPEAIAALRREFLQAQSLAHPGLVKVFDFDRDGDTHFITMELIDGELLSSLLDRLRPGKLPRADALRILGALGGAVAHAHEHGVLHLDLKPGNVMITARDEIRVLDFGLAHPHVREPWISDGPPAFHAATPTYASCERIAGTSPDARDDVFSLACIAYELLSGEHPFNRSSAREARAEGRKARRIRGLPRRQWQALSRGLAWTREDRTRTVVELLAGIGAAIATRPAPVMPRRASDARRPGSFLGGMMLALLVAGSVMAYLQRERWLPVASERAEALTAAIAAALETARTGARPASTGTLPAPAAVADPGSAPAAAQPAPPPDVIPEPAAAAGVTPDEPVSVEPAPVPPEAQADPVSPTPPDVAARTEPAATMPAPGHAQVDTVAEVAVAVTPAPAAPRRRGRVQLAADSVTVSESERVARIKVRRVGGSDGRLSFLWRTAGDSAVGDEDFAETGWNEEILASGQVSTTLLVPIVEDLKREHTELFDVVLGSTEDDTVLGTITTTTVILVDDD